MPGIFGVTKRRQRAEGVDYPFSPGRPGSNWQRAGKALREQAIQRTLMEVQFPHKIWGLEGRMGEFRALTNVGTLLTERVLSEEAKIRLSLLRAVNV